MYLSYNWNSYERLFRFLSSCDKNINAIYIRGSSCDVSSKYDPWDIDIICFYKNNSILLNDSYKLILDEVASFNEVAILKKIPYIDLSIHPFIQSLDISNIHLFLKLSHSHLHIYGNNIDFKLLKTIPVELKYQLLQSELSYIEKKITNLQQEINPLFYTLKYKHLIKAILRLGNIIAFLFSSDNFFSRDVTRGLNILVSKYQLTKLDFLYQSLSLQNITDQIQIVYLWNQIIKVVNSEVKWNKK